jgi:predicted nucleotidyltransferase component of viral defense system
VIARRELQQLRTEWSLDIGVIEKDYVLGWLLAGVAQHGALAETWVFKGGTCLRKCFYETFRFSEDLDFTIISGGPEEPDQLLEIFSEIGAWLLEESGVQIVLDDKSFRRRQNKRGLPTTEGRIAYSGPNASRGTLPKIKLDLTSDEVLADRPVWRKIGHPYSDGLPARRVLCYSLVELFGEKLRALAERCRPRDLYDVVHMHRHPDLIGLTQAVRYVLDQKCAHAAIEVPTLEAIQSSPLREEIEAEWANMLAHQLPSPLPPFAGFWSTLTDVFSWLEGRLRIPTLPRAEFEKLDPTWQPPRAITTWRRNVPLELLRYAGLNRLKVDVDYRAETGRQGLRLVEPYSLRHTRDGNLVLQVINDYGRPRSYRVDRIAGIRPTAVPFTPRFRVEF